MRGLFWQTSSRLSLQLRFTDEGDPGKVFHTVCVEIRATSSAE